MPVERCKRRYKKGEEESQDRSGAKNKKGRLEDTAVSLVDGNNSPF